MTSRGNGYDLSCFFDCLHDMGRPVDAARHAARFGASRRPSTFQSHHRGAAL